MTNPKENNDYGASQMSFLLLNPLCVTMLSMNSSNFFYYYFYFIFLWFLSGATKMPVIKIETSVSGYCHTTFKISFDYFKYDLTE